MGTLNWGPKGVIEKKSWGIPKGALLWDSMIGGPQGSYLKQKGHRDLQGDLFFSEPLSSFLFRTFLLLFFSALTMTVSI
jgi:hypothetical protein